MEGRAYPNVVFIVGDNVGWGDIGCYLVGAAVALIGDAVVVRFQSRGLFN